MAAATMSSFAPTAPLGVFVPSTPMVVKRETRRRRRHQGGDAPAEKRHTKRRAVRQGFVFDAPSHEEDAAERSARPSAAAAASAASSAATTFAFRVRKSPGPASPPPAGSPGVDAAHVTEALRKKQERAKERALKVQRLAKRKAETEKDEQVEAALLERHALSRDQMALYYAVRDQAKRELRKTMRDFARSAARADILELTEKSLEAIKGGVVDFLTEHPPSQTVETVPNPENARLKALIESYEARIKELESEETQWTTMRDALDAATPSTEAERASEQKQVALSVTTEIGNLQRAVISEVDTSAQRLLVIQDSMKSIDRLALQAEIQKSKLFDAFHDSAFKGYIQDPKETLRALLKLAPPSTSQ